MLFNLLQARDLQLFGHLDWLVLAQ